MAAVFSARGGVLLVGHRGGRGAGWPAENTVAAFERARAEGAPAVELDVRTCRGDHVVVFHDADLARMTDGTDRRSVSQLTLGEIARARIGDSNDHVPTFDDLLAWADGKVALNVEAKHDVRDRPTLVRGIARALARHPRVEVLLSSFDPVLLSMLAAALPRVPRAWLSEESQLRWQRFWMPAALRAPLHAVHLARTEASPEAIVAFHRAGKRVGVWTVNDAGEARDLLALGVDWIITDAPGALAAALA